MNTGLIQQKTQQNLEAKKTEAGKQTVSALMNSLLDSEKMKTRFDSLLGKRAPQFISSLITLVNADENLQRAFYEAPMTVIQAGLKAASFDLPIEPSLGFAYIVPFNNSYKDARGEWQKKTEATFILGYKGLVQLCLRTGAYSRIPDAVEVREGELVSYDRLTGDAVFNWIEDEDERDKLPIIGYAGYFRLKNGAEKTIYMSRKQIEAHEAKNRKGKNMGKGWKDDFDSMAKKTVIRRLINHYGLMSIDYQSGDEATVKAAENVLTAGREDFDEIPVVEGTVVDERTGEIFGGVDEAFPWEEEQK
ncbi:MAG: recombinase RecT [Oscillospiraceae bacterium]|nr:recombinase RecT [Oscillospiraceae bacterium]